MNPIILKNWMVMAMMCLSISASAYDFKADGVCYKIISESNRTIEVTYLHDDYMNGDYGYGVVDIPSKLIYQGKTYTVVAIGANAFQYSRGLTAVTIPPSVTEIKSSAFNTCRNLKKVTIPNSVIEIGSSAFETCTSLSEATLSENLKTIYDYAFHNCWSISNISIPSSVERIGYGAFMDCSNLSMINVAESNGSYTSEDGVLFTKDKSCVVQYPVARKSQVYLLPETISIIGGGAFRNCKNLTTIHLPNNIYIIEQEAFSYCSGLLNIALPDNIVEIGNAAFRSCSSISECILPNKLTSISDYLFEDCNSLNKIILPNSLISVGYDSFKNCKSLIKVDFPDSLQKLDNGSFSGCGLITLNLPPSIKEIRYNAFGNCPIEDIFCNWTDPIECSNGAFDSWIYSIAKLYIPIGTTNKYTTIDPWRNFFDIIESEQCSSIENNLYNPLEIFDIYNITGLLVKRSININELYSLPHGIYIVKSEGKTLKIKI